LLVEEEVGEVEAAVLLKLAGSKGKEKKRAAAAVADVASVAEDEGKSKKAKRQRLEEPAAAGEAEEAGPGDGMDAGAYRTKMLINSEAELPDPVQSFQKAPFGKKLRAALQGAGFAEPTAIQAQGWPVLAAGDDLVGVAKTGSGKTLAFLMPAFRRIAKEQPDCSSGPAALVLAPTRELAMQIEEAAVRFGKEAGVTTASLYGGVPKPPQVKALKAGPQVVVATPGRLMDLMRDGTAKLQGVTFLVLDEADRMLDMGFEPQMVEIMKQIPAERQTALFSATWPKSVQKLARSYMRPEAVRVNIGETEELAANKAVSQEFFKLDDSEKDDKLWRFISTLDEKAKVIVFANTKRRIDNLQKNCWACGWTCVAMHGDKTQQDRDKGMADFVAGKSPLMFATDVCARGLDIKDVTHVVNYDMARDVESYIHRIGRTGRAGASGTSITYVNDAFDTECAPALIKIAKEAGQEVPEWLTKIASKAKEGKNKLWKY